MDKDGSVHSIENYPPTSKSEMKAHAEQLRDRNTCTRIREQVLNTPPPITPHNTFHTEHQTIDHLQTLHYPKAGPPSDTSGHPPNRPLLAESLAIS